MQSVVDIANSRAAPPLPHPFCSLLPGPGRTLPALSARQCCTYRVRRSGRPPERSPTPAKTARSSSLRPGAHAPPAPAPPLPRVVLRRRTTRRTRAPRPELPSQWRPGLSARTSSGSWGRRGWRRGGAAAWRTWRRRPSIGRTPWPWRASRPAPRRISRTGASPAASPAACSRRTTAATAWWRCARVRAGWAARGSCLHGAPTWAQPTTSETRRCTSRT